MSALDLALLTVDALTFVSVVALSAGATLLLLTTILHLLR